MLTDGSSATYAAKRIASIEDDEMREFDPDEHLEMLAHGIPEQYGNILHACFFLVVFFHCSYITLSSPSQAICVRNDN